MAEIIGIARFEIDYRIFLEMNPPSPLRGWTQKAINHYLQVALPIGTGLLGFLRD